MPARFTNIRSWQRHVLNCHSQPYEDDSTTCDSAPDIEQNPDSSTSDSESDIEQFPQDHLDQPHVYTEVPQPHTGHPGASGDSMFMVASFLNYLRDQHMPEKVCTDAARYVEKIGQQLLLEKENACGELPCMNALRAFQSNHKYEKYVEDHLPFVQPETVVVGQKENAKHDSYQYIPLRSQLQHLLKLPQLHSFIFDEPTENEKRATITDIFDGTAHPLREKNTVYISISYDDFEVANPLGSAAGVHKLAALTFSLLNAPAELRSKVDSIFLLILSLSSIVREYGWEVILSRLVDDLKELGTTGMKVFVRGEMVTVFVKLLFIPGDNLAVHNIAGFVESFSGKSPCRFCNTSSDDMQHKFAEEDFELRTSTVYKEQLKSLEDCGFLPEAVQQSGIKRKCVFSELSGFDVTKSFPPDIGHDLLEGVLPYTLSLVLNTIICTNKYISLSEVNDLLRAFPWRSTDNAPMPIRQGKGGIRIRQSASQSWTLLRYLPLIIGHYIPPHCVEWSLLTNLCCIVERAFARSFTNGDISFLKFKVADWLTDLRRAYPEFRLKPKFHYMVHYASEIVKHGPIRHCWTMRFESKYSFLKGVVKENKNFRNIARTISRKHQHHMAFALHSPSFMRTGQTHCLKIMEECTFPGGICTELRKQGYTMCEHAEIGGVTYSFGDIVLITQDGEEGFGEICAVCIGTNSQTLVLRVMSSEYDGMTNSFEVCPTDMVKTVELHSLRDAFPLHPVKMNDARCYVVLNYHA